MRPIGLEHLSLVDVTALDLIAVGAELGCARVSLFVSPVPMGPALDLVNDRSARATVLRDLRDLSRRPAVC